uniref:Uncharacterized protein n=1 Tax=Caenorhabditis japonica TaxID=281687 RepID=A0A8R1E9M2_CAEJA
MYVFNIVPFVSPKIQIVEQGQPSFEQYAPYTPTKIKGVPQKPSTAKSAERMDKTSSTSTSTKLDPETYRLTFKRATQVVGDNAKTDPKRMGRGMDPYMIRYRSTRPPLYNDQGEGSKESAHQRRRLERVSATKEKARKSPGENSEKSSSGENPRGFRELTLQRVTTEFETHVV